MPEINYQMATYPGILDDEEARSDLASTIPPQRGLNTEEDRIMNVEVKKVRDEHRFLSPEPVAT